MQNTMSTAETGDNHWEKFAEEDPYTYVLTSLKNGDAQEFWKSGERTVEEELVPLVKARKICPGIGLELGCGLGRLVFPLAAYFLEVVGVDITEGMVQRAQQRARVKGIRNVRFRTIAGPEDLLQDAGNYAGRINFLYSLLVFQHISDLRMIAGYLKAVAMLLEENGIAYLQFDTRPKSFAYHVKSYLPDFVLPRFWRKGIRRIRRSSDEIEECMRGAGLEIIGELTPATAYHRYILRRARGAAFWT
jgi:cyclopropane fatty-acyl-phospholipid synthase-like methyltransferase